MSMKSGRALEGLSVPSSSGDSGAFEALVLKWRPVLLSLSQEILSDADEAEDVAQCILTRLWVTGTWTEIAWPGAYIRQAARREALMMRQKRRRWASLGHPELLAFPSGGPDPAEAVEKQEFLERLEDRIRALPPRCGLVMALTHLQGLTHSEAAERLGISEKAVEKQVRRGRDRLRKWLEREEDGSVSWQSQNSGGGGEALRAPSLAIMGSCPSCGGFAMTCGTLAGRHASRRSVGSGERSRSRTEVGTLLWAVFAVVLPFTALGCADESFRASAIGVSTPPSAELHGLEWNVDTITAVGVLEGAEDFQFVGLREASVHPGAEFSVLDMRGGRVALFDSAGQHLKSIQSRGEGPGEFQLPVAHAVNKEGDLFVLDRQLARLSHFRLTSGEMEFVEMRRVNYRLTSLCVLNDTLWFGGIVGGRLAHRVDEQGAIEVSIGTPPEIEGIERLGDFGEALAYPQLVRPKMHCDDETGLLILASLSHPRVQAYRGSGEVVWSKDLPGFTSIQFERTESGGLRDFSHPERGSHLLFSLVPWVEGQVLIQYEVRRDEQDCDRPRPATMDSRLIDLATGEVLSRSNDLPPILGGKGDLLVIAGQELFPQALLVRRLQQ
jgi:RNA polymerase sigma-70 factor (ECF subfamily)